MGMGYKEILFSYFGEIVDS